MRSFLSLLTITLFVFACSKDNVSGDLSGKEYIRGRLLLLDTLTQRVLGDPLPNKTLSIGYADAADTINYLFTTKSDDQGYFVFSNLKKDKEYRIYYEEKTGDFYQTARGVATAPVDSFRLYAQPSTTKQNGIYYTILDPSGTPVKGAKVCIFASTTAYGGGVCEQSTYPLTSSDLGRAFKFNVPKGTYYTIASLGVNNTNYSVKDTITVGDTVVRKMLTLLPSKQVGFKYLVLDSIGGKVGNINVCVFTSLVLFNQGNCAGANYQVPVDANGIALKTDLPPGHYYLLAQVTAGNLALIAKDSVDVLNKVEIGTLILKKQ